jgi:hypothetical protein
MKKALIIISIFSFSITAVAQTIEPSEVPKLVASNLHKTHPYPENIKWEMDYDNYVARFDKDKVKVSITYNKDGEWIKTETPVTHKSLPAAVKSCMTKQFDIYKENYIEKVEKPDGVFYHIDLEYNQLDYEVVISESGELIKKEQIKEYKKD